MEFIRKNFICQNQIRKGRSGSRDLIKNFKKGSSIALMIDQRLGRNLCAFFKKNAQPLYLHNCD